MKPRIMILALAIALAGCYTAHLDCPCAGGSTTASVGGQTALLDAILPILQKAAGGAVAFGVAGPMAATEKPQMCGSVDTSGIDLLGTATISCASLPPGAK